MTLYVYIAICHIFFKKLSPFIYDDNNEDDTDVTRLLLFLSSLLSSRRVDIYDDTYCCDRRHLTMTLRKDAHL